MLMVRREREVLLRLRPDSGIWGGLWSLPEMPVDTVPFDAEAAEAAALDYARAYGAPVRAAMAGELTHVFTHFRLLIRAIRVDVGAGDLMVQDSAMEAAMEAGQRWLSLDDLDALGTPAPVRRLLEDQARGGLF
ncbi:A/G-specific adenine glycosylase [compost metagenome]